MKTVSALLVGALVCVVFTGAKAAEPPAAQPAPQQQPVETGLVPYRALYSVALVGAGRQSDFVSAEGKYYTENKMDCDGTTSDSRMRIYLYTKEGHKVEMRSGNVMWEAKNSLDYRYEARASMGGNIVNARSGTATLASAGGSGTAQDRKGGSIALPAGTLFPVAASRELLRAAAAGEAQLQTRIFDGQNTTGGISEITSFISAPVPVSIAAAKAGREGKPDVSWPVRMVMRDPGAAQSGPSAEMLLSVLPNGVIEQMTTQMGDFSLRMTLDSLKLLPLPTCGN